MSPPRHLWSGDWKRESAEARQELAKRRGTVDAPAQPAVSEPPTPRVSALDRAQAALGSGLDRARDALHAGLDRSRAALRSGLDRLRTALRPARRVREPLLVGLGMLVTAGAAYALVTALRTSGTHSSPAAQRTSRLSSRPGWLGVDIHSFPLANGALIVAVAPGGPADRGGLQPGDVITAIDNRSVQSPADLNAVLAGLHAGQRVQINYQQGPLSFTTQVSLQARSSGP